METKEDGVSNCIKIYEDIKKDKDKQGSVEFGKIYVITDFDQNNMDEKMEGNLVKMD